MTPRRFFRLILWVCVLGFLVWKYAPWPARTLVFQEQNCECRIPYNWTITDKPGYVLEAHRPTGGTFVITSGPVRPSAPYDDPSFLQDIKNEMVTEGNEFLQESREPFQGHIAYSYTLRKTINGMQIYTHNVSFDAGALRYHLTISKRGIDPWQDSQLQDAVNSFSLISPAQ